HKKSAKKDESCTITNESQCDGQNWTFSTCCADPNYECRKSDDGQNVKRCQKIADGDYTDSEDSNSDDDYSHTDDDSYVDDSYVDDSYVTTATLTISNTRATWTTGVTARVSTWAARTRRATASSTRSATPSASQRLFHRESSVARMMAPTCGGTRTARVVSAANPRGRTTAAPRPRSATTTVASAVRTYNAVTG
ncbi:hypothetical protein PC111_g25100, partial [Phytophthora cactorum]